MKNETKIIIEFDEFVEPNSYYIFFRFVYICTSLVRYSPCKEPQRSVLGTREASVG